MLSADVETFLAKAISPPRAEAVHEAVVLLQCIGALHVSAPDGPGENSGLTDLGCQLAQLPVDPLVGKMIILGLIFR